MNETDNEKWEVEQTETPEQEEQDIITYQIASYPTDLTLSGYLDKWKSKQLYVPEFQRGFVWDQVRASKLIESFLLGLPVPGVFLYKERKSNRLQVIDGQQRIFSAIKYFTNDFEGKPFHLKNVHPKWDGKSYLDLDESERFQLDDSVLRATVVQQLDPSDDTSIYHIFERLNTGGVSLTPMEIRKCVYLSDFYQLLEELNALPAWRAIIGKTTPDKRLRDVEYILRIFALRDFLHIYVKPMKQFLNQYMAQKRELNSVGLARMKFNFIDVCEYTLNQLGEKPFHIRGRLNYAALDSVMATAFEAVEKKIDDFGIRYKLLLEDKDYLEAVTSSTSDEKTVQKRFAVAKEYLTK